jgi:hypothetical protein
MVIFIKGLGHERHELLLTKTFFEDLGLLIVKKKCTNLICGKHISKTFAFAFMSKT